MADNRIFTEKGETLRTPIVDETSLGFMLKLAGPIVITTISFTLLQFVDRIMVSRPIFAQRNIYTVVDIRR